LLILAYATTVHKVQGDPGDDAATSASHIEVTDAFSL
jgi:hypothetical protein